MTDRTKRQMEHIPLPRTSTIVAMLASAYRELEGMARANKDDGWRVYGMNAILLKHEYRLTALNEDQVRIVIYYLKALGLIRNIGVKATDGEWWVRPRGQLGAAACVSLAALERLIADGRVPTKPVVVVAEPAAAVAS